MQMQRVMVRVATGAVVTVTGRGITVDAPIVLPCGHTCVIRFASLPCLDCALAPAPKEDDHD